MKIKRKAFLILTAVIFIVGLLAYKVYGQFKSREIQAQSLQEQGLLSKKNKQSQEKGKSKKNQQKQEKKEKDKNQSQSQSQNRIKNQEKETSGQGDKSNSKGKNQLKSDLENPDTNAPDQAKKNSSVFDSADLGNQNPQDEQNQKLNPAKAYSQNKEKIIKNLKQISQKQKQEQSKKAIQEIVEEEEEIKEEVEESLEEQEQRGELKTLLLGADYKNLGQLRKALVQNTNQIRKLENILETTTDQELQKKIKEQINASKTEQRQLEEFIKKNEEQFSIFGWAFKLIYGYDDLSDSDQEDDADDTQEQNDDQEDQEDEESGQSQEGSNNEENY